MPNNKTIKARFRDKKPFVMGRFEVIPIKQTNKYALNCADTLWWTTCSSIEFSEAKENIKRILEPMGFTN